MYMIYYIINYIKSTLIFFHFDGDYKIEFFALITSDIAIAEYI